jgi:hypothetical protein
VFLSSGKKYRQHLYSEYRYMLEEEFVQIGGDKIKDRIYVKFQACDSLGFGAGGNHLYFLCLVKNCFCEFDNNEYSFKNLLIHNCGDPNHRFKLTLKNIPIPKKIFEGDNSITRSNQLPIVLDEEFFFKNIMDPVCYFLAESGSAFGVAEYSSFREMRRNDMSILSKYVLDPELERMLKSAPF